MSIFPLNDFSDFKLSQTLTCDRCTSEPLLPLPVTAWGKEDSGAWNSHHHYDWILLKWMNLTAIIEVNYSWLANKPVSILLLGIISCLCLINEFLFFNITISIYYFIPSLDVNKHGHYGGQKTQNRRGAQRRERRVFPEVATLNLTCSPKSSLLAI